MKWENGWNRLSHNPEISRAFPRHRENQFTVLTLQRITSEYVATEDRFRLSGITDKGGEVSYWVTQRLLLRLLNFLLDWLETHRGELEQQAATDMLGPMVTKAATSPARGEAKVSQKEAGSEEGGEDNKEAEAGEIREEDRAATAELLFEADIRIAATRITVVFKPRKSEHAQLSLQLDEAWQWVAILHTLWRRADWNLSAWPDWVEKVKAPHPSKSVGYLH